MPCRTICSGRFVCPKFSSICAVSRVPVESCEYGTGIQPQKEPPACSSRRLVLPCEAFPACNCAFNEGLRGGRPSRGADACAAVCDGESPLYFTTNILSRLGLVEAPPPRLTRTNNVPNRTRKVHHTSPAFPTGQCTLHPALGSLGPRAAWFVCVWGGGVPVGKKLRSPWPARFASGCVTSDICHTHTH